MKVGLIQAEQCLNVRLRKHPEKQEGRRQSGKLLNVLERK